MGTPPPSTSPPAVKPSRLVVNGAYSACQFVYALYLSSTLSVMLQCDVLELPN